MTGQFFDVGSKVGTVALQQGMHSSTVRRTFSPEPVHDAAGIGVFGVGDAERRWHLRHSGAFAEKAVVPDGAGVDCLARGLPGSSRRVRRTPRLCSYNARCSAGPSGYGRSATNTALWSLRNLGLLACWAALVPGVLRSAVVVPRVIRTHCRCTCRAA